MQSGMIYADHCATTKLCDEAMEAMLPFLRGSYGNPSQPYFFGRESRKAISEAREVIASCIHAEPEEIVFTSGGTESDNWVIKGTEGDVITTPIEHHAVLNSCEDIRRFGRNTFFIPVDGEGTADIRKLNAQAFDKAGLVSVMFANNELGTIEPVREITEAAHAKGLLFHTDAVQAVGHLPIDVKALNVDLLSASAHKFQGPKGAGFLYIRKGSRLRSFVTGGAQESGRRAGTENTAGIVGMAAALRKSCEQMEQARKHLTALEQIITQALDSAGTDYVRNGSAQHLPGVLNLSFRGKQGESLLHRMDLKGICISTGSACDSKNTELSHVLKAISLPEEYALGTVRISLGAENTVQEAQTIADALIEIC